MSDEAKSTEMQENSLLRQMASTSNGNSVLFELTDTNLQTPMEAAEALEPESMHSRNSRDSNNIPIVEYDPIDYSGNLTVLQSQVLLEDAVHFRSIHHKLDVTSLRIYRFYHSFPTQVALGAVIAILHLLAIFEHPSSLTITSDIRTAKRVEVPCWVTQIIEVVCLMLLLLDVTCKTYFFGKKRSLRNPWLLGYWGALGFSIVDWMVSTCFFCDIFRARRFLRPYFLLQRSSIMKKTIKCLRNAVAEVFSVLLFLAVLIYLFTLIGMCIFPDVGGDDSGSSGDNSNNSSGTRKEAIHYFRNFPTSIFSLLVLVTTANHPDIMMPVYNINRFFALYFVVFVVIGLFCLTNMLTAVVFNQFRGYFLSSIQTQLFRRRVAFAAAYQVLCRGKSDLRATFGNDRLEESRTEEETSEEGVQASFVRRIICGVRMREWRRDLILDELRKYTGCVLNFADFRQVLAFMDETNHKRVTLQPRHITGRVLPVLQQIFLSRWFDLFGMLVCVINIIVVTVEVTLRYDRVFGAEDVGLEYVNYIFVAFYLFEQLGKLWAHGFLCYVSYRWNVFDMLFTAALVIMQIIQVIITSTTPQSHNANNGQLGLTVWDGARIVNLLIILRILRLVPRINAMRLVGSTIRDLLQNLKSFAGVLVVAYYVFALLGMQLFGGVIKKEELTAANASHECGSYAQLNYWSNNFDDFLAAIMTLWDIMVVNNWHVIVEAYAKAAGEWSRLYFVAWWLLSVLVILNLVVALIIENFIQRWDKNDSGLAFNMNDQNEMFQSLSLYAMFKSSLQEPPVEKLKAELSLHPEFTVFASDLSDAGCENPSFVETDRTSINA